MSQLDAQMCRLAVDEALQVISGKWASVVIRQLCQGPQRFNQLQRNLGNISIKSLTDSLRQLEQYEVVHRRVFPTVPVSVEYSLTEKGKEFGAILLEMRKWGEKWGTLKINKSQSSS